MGAGGLFIQLLFPAGSANFDTFAMLQRRSMTNQWVRCFDDCYLGDERISMALSPNGRNVLFTSSQNLSIVILSLLENKRPLSSNKKMKKTMDVCRENQIFLNLIFARKTHFLHHDKCITAAWQRCGGHQNPMAQPNRETHKNRCSQIQLPTPSSTP